jgi:hypothetical protein
MAYNFEFLYKDVLKCVFHRHGGLDSRDKLISRSILWSVNVKKISFADF